LILDEVKQRQAEQNWPEALAAARRAEALLAGGGGGNESQQRQVRQVLADLEMVRRLEQIRLERAETVHTDRPTTYEKPDRNYAAAFRDYGIDLDRLGETEAVDRLRSRPGVVLALATALDRRHRASR
jgi:hypothetical protein